MLTRKSPETSVKESTKSDTAQSKSSWGGGRSGKTRVQIKYDVGFSNALYIRGKGANLSWDKGIQLKNVKPDLWVWETEAPFSVAEFKVLINDQVYESGENRTIKSGSQVEYSPKFS